MYKRKIYKGAPVDDNEVFVCDAQADLANLPTDSPPGSSAFVIEDSTTWMIDSSGRWTQTVFGGGGDITTIALSVSKDGTYIAPAGKAYNRVAVDVNTIPEASSDGGVHIRIHIDDGADARKKMSLSWDQSVAQGVSVDWGDGTDPVAYYGTGTAAVTYTYENAGDYDIVLSLVSGTLSFERSNGTGGMALYGPKDNQYSYMRTRITDVSFGDDIDSVGSYSLQYCYSIKGANVGEGITSIGDGAFYSCHALEGVSMPTTLTSIGDSAFYYCYSLDNIVIPDSVTTIGESAFYNCVSLKSITMPSSLESISNYMFYGCNNLSGVEIPSGVVSIGDGAFNGCKGISSLTIPSSVTTIGIDAFANCYGIAEYHFEATTPPTLTNTGVFSNMASDCVIYVPNSYDHSILNAYKSATNWSSFAARIQEEAGTV